MPSFAVPETQWVKQLQKIQFFSIFFPFFVLEKKSPYILVKLSYTALYENCLDLLWEKIVLVNEKNSRNSRLKADNFQKIW
jgi:hypothetical protein